MADAVIAVGWVMALLGTGVWMAYLAGKLLLVTMPAASARCSEHFTVLGGCTK